MVKTLILPIIHTRKTQFVIKPVLKPPRVNPDMEFIHMGMDLG